MATAKQFHEFRKAGKLTEERTANGRVITCTQCGATFEIPNGYGRTYTEGERRGAARHVLTEHPAQS